MTPPVEDPCPKCGEQLEFYSGTHESLGDYDLERCTGCDYVDHQ